MDIVIKGAREHNLKNISLTIPKNKFVVITGLSGSGKSSLAFDTIYAEGQRRYLESLSSYARQFLEQMKKPNIDVIDGLSPSISIEQKSITGNPRSTVGTITEIYDYLRLLYAKIGIPHCPNCGKEISKQSIQDIIKNLTSFGLGTRIIIYSPIVRHKKGEYEKLLNEFKRNGFTKAKIDEKEVSLLNPIKLNKKFHHDISILIDKIVINNNIEKTLSDSLALASELSNGLIEIDFIDLNTTKLFSTLYACTQCGINIAELEPRNFSFNSPFGACNDCDGLGVKVSFDIERFLLNSDLPLRILLVRLATKIPQIEDFLIIIPNDIDLKIPFSKLNKEDQYFFLYGSKNRLNKIEFPGLVPYLERFFYYEDTFQKGVISDFIVKRVCPSCHGSRLKPESLSVTIDGKNISEMSLLTISDLAVTLDSLKVSKFAQFIADPILTEIKSKLSFLMNVGLSYLSLSRSVNSLSGGELQRIKLATQIGSNLTGVLYVLDEPSIGLHQKDNLKLISALKQLRDNGNSIIVVEHDRETIEQADFIVDLGPSAGTHGGEIVFSGTFSQLKNEDTLTAKYLSNKLKVPSRENYRNIDNEKTIKLKNVTTNNLKKITVEFPLGVFVCVTGVSGSGKSSLVIDSLLPLAEMILNNKSLAKILTVESVTGLEKINRVIYVDQSPIGRTPRSNPATYTGVLTDIRKLFSGLPESKIRAYSMGRFSFNTPGGRCESCKGNGYQRISLQFLPDTFVKCDVCQGKRYNRETLEITYKNKNIADVLEMTVEEAYNFFERIPSIKSKLSTLLQIGLGYLALGQNSTTLSGGEAQRIKLARELSKKNTGKSLYILDEPTTGLHFHDITNLIKCLHALVDKGNTIIVIEHNMDVIKQADYIIDLGPEGGEKGGYLLFQGPISQFLNIKNNDTAYYLKKHLLL